MQITFRDGYKVITDDLSLEEVERALIIRFGRLSPGMEECKVSLADGSRVDVPELWSRLVTDGNFSPRDAAAAPFDLAMRLHEFWRDNPPLRVVMDKLYKEACWPGFERQRCNGRRAA